MLRSDLLDLRLIRVERLDTISEAMNHPEPLQRRVGSDMSIHSPSGSIVGFESWVNSGLCFGFRLSLGELLGYWRNDWH